MSPISTMCSHVFKLISLDYYYYPLEVIEMCWVNSTGRRDHHELSNEPPPVTGFTDRNTKRMTLWTSKKISDKSSAWRRESFFSKTNLVVCWHSLEGKLRLRGQQTERMQNHMLSLKMRWPDQIPLSQSDSVWQHIHMNIINCISFWH